MKTYVAMIHTSATMIPVFKPLAAELLGPDVDVFNMVDESLLRDIIRDKGCLPPTARRVVGHVLAAEQAGARFILVTCSSIGPAVELGAKLSSAVVMRVDDAMACRAIGDGTRIGVAATLPSTLNPTVDLIRAQAVLAGKSITVTPKLIDGAFDAVISGDGATHDKLVGAAVQALSNDVDVIVLAQASMARVVDALPADARPKPILASPRLAMEQLAERVRKA